MVINSHDRTYRLDNYTDSQIIMQAYNLRCGDPSTIFSNPKHEAVDEDGLYNMALALDEVVKGAECETNYPRYWMGFRAYVRPLLMIGSYADIRQIVAFVYFALLLISFLTVYKYRGKRTAACFAVSMLLVNPAIISQSFQFSICFVLAFIFSIYVLLREDSKKSIYLPLVFGVFGALTQFFDFYTTPIITYGIPILVLLASSDFSGKRFLISLKTLVTWSWGYVGMWIMKLMLTTIFTDINAFANGFNSVSYRLGIGDKADPKCSYNSFDAIKEVFRTFAVRNHPKMKYILIAVIVIFAIFLFICMVKKVAAFKMTFLFVAVIPFVWWAIAAQPTIIHAWFQYRSICVSIFGVLLFMSSVISNMKCMRIFRRKDSLTQIT